MVVLLQHQATRSSGCQSLMCPGSCSSLMTALLRLVSHEHVFAPGSSGTTCMQSDTALICDQMVGRKADIAARKAVAQCDEEGSMISCLSTKRVPKPTSSAMCGLQIGIFRTSHVRQKVIDAAREGG